MAYRKRTLRRMTPKARQLGKLIGELESVAKRLKNLVPEIERLEVDLRAEQKRQAHFKNAGGGDIKEKPQPSETTHELEQSNIGANQC